MEDQLGWYVLGVVSALIGAAHLDQAASGGRSRPLALVASAVAGYLGYRNWSWLSEGGDDLRLVVWSLLFCALSPVLGFLWWGRGGKARRALLRLLVFSVCLLAGLVLWSSTMSSSRLATVLSMVGATLVVLPWRRWMQAWKHRRRLLLTEQPAKSLPCEASDSAVVRKTLAEYRESFEFERRERTQLAERLTLLETAAAEGNTRTSRRREEITEQVRLVRQAEVRRIKAGHDGLQFHEDFGFLMAEAWRVLRAEIAAGERFPALEHDTFFEQVVADLLATPDFETRYFHAGGRAAIGAVNSYLSGREMLAEALEAVRAQQLGPELLAPRPLQGELAGSLVEAWLVPHRRFQRTAWEKYLEGEHSRQEELRASFVEQGIVGEPTVEQWKHCWDVQPADFVLTTDSVEVWSTESRHGAREIRVPGET